MPSLTKYEKFVQEIADRSAEMRRVLVTPFRKDDGTFATPTNRAEARQRDQILENAIRGTVYETVQNGPMIAAVHSRSLQAYERTHGHGPSDELLASASKAIENALLLTSGRTKLEGTIFENAEMSTTDGLIMRDRLVSLVLPVMLSTITANMVTFMPGDFNQSEFFRIKRVAGSTFGDLKKGDIIEWNYTGNYSVMDKIETLTAGDGTTKNWKFDSKTKFGVVYPFKRHSVRVELDGHIVAQDNADGVIFGSFVSGGETNTVTGTVDYATGNVSFDFATAPATGLTMVLCYDVDIEKAPELIPRIDHVMQSRILYPHESAIAGSATIQALWAIRREIGQDIENLNMQGLRNVLAGDKDRKHLKDMRRHAKGITLDWVRTRPDALTLSQHYESLNRALLEIDSKMRVANGITGIVGIVAGSGACNIFRYLPAQYFQPAPGFVSVAQPHYVGKVFGQFDLYCDPTSPESYSAMCFGKGPDYGQTAYVAGDAVPALTFRHPVMGDLTTRSTMWDLAYRDMQPFDGDKYLATLNMIEE